jgi:putative hydrolase of the HAD superfamily
MVKMNWALMAAEAIGAAARRPWSSHAAIGPTIAAVIKAVLFDFGGVLTTSPFEAFASYEAEAGLPPDTIRRLNSTNPDTNAWAAFERREVGTEEFCRLFEAEAAALGLTVDAERVLTGLRGDLRPTMVEALRRCSAEFPTALLTNNVEPMADGDMAPEFAEVVDMFDVVVESSVVGCRKPEQRFYEIACGRLGVEAPECVFLDDLGVNLKPARAMGMTTIKVGDPAAAIAELSAAVGLALS